MPPTKNSGGIVVVPPAQPQVQLFNPVNIGGGGFVTGLFVYPDGTMVCRTDVFNVYVSNVNAGNAWKPGFTSASTPTSLFGFSNTTAGGTMQFNFSGGAAGGYSVAAAPSNTQIIYSLWQGKMMFTSNQGATWVVMSNFPAISFSSDANTSDATRTNQGKIRVDPNDAGTVYIGTPADGFFVTHNGTLGASATFAAVPNVPAPAGRNDFCGIDFDATSGTTGGRTNSIAICVGASGVWFSSNAGVSFALSSGSPTSFSDGRFGTESVSPRTYFVGGATVYMFRSGTWTSLGTGPNAFGVPFIAADPNNPNRIAGFGNGGSGYTEGIITGTTIAWASLNFVSGTTGSTPPSDVGWFTNVAPPGVGYNYSAVGGFWDPSVTNRFWFCYGYGVGYGDIPTPYTGQQITYVARHKGIENMVARFVASMPGFASPLMFVEDQQMFQIVDPTIPPSSSAAQIGSRAGNAAAWSADWSQSNVGHVVALNTGYYVSKPNKSGFSTNGGSSWTIWNTPPTTTDGGCITCIDADHIVVVSNFNGTAVPSFTSNGTSANPTWSATNLPNQLYGGNGFLGKFDYTQPFCNDAGGTAYVYVNPGGFYTSNAAAWGTFTNVAPIISGVTTGGSNCTFKAVPNNAGVLFISEGFNFQNTYPTGQAFYKSTNGAVTWNAVSNVQDVWLFGFGQVYPGFTFPTLWIMGFVTVSPNPAKWGIWRSRDLGVSDWTFISYLGSGIDYPVTMSGDMTDYKKVYIGYEGNSFVYGSNIT